MELLDKILRDSRAYLISKLREKGIKVLRKNKHTNKSIAELAFKILDPRNPKLDIKNQYNDYIVNLADYLIMSKRHSENPEKLKQSLELRKRQYTKMSKLKEAEKLSTYKTPSNYQPFHSNKTVKYVQPS